MLNLFNIFCPLFQSHEVRTSATPSDLQNVLQRIQSDLLILETSDDRNNQRQNHATSPNLPISAPNSGLVHLPKYEVNLDASSEAESLFGLVEKHAAVESTLFLVEQLRSLTASMKSCLPDGDKEGFIDHYNAEVRIGVDV